MKRRILWCFALATVSLPACTAVLGMEDAKLDDGLGAAATGGTSAGGSGGSGGGAGGNAGSGGTGTRPPPTDPPDICDVPETDCVRCLDGCAGKGECLTSSECRKSLDTYRSCLNESCVDANGQCANRLLSSTDAATQKLHSCLTDACADNCTTGPVASMCELYCRCMSDKCPAKAEAGATCMDDCAQLDQKAVYCRWTHCEAASSTNLQHCDHAVGLLGHCPRSTPGNTCTNKIHSGFPCKTDSDCCSNACRTEVCQ
jgi:hypothetical protein